MSALNLLSRLAARSVDGVWGEVVRITPLLATPYAIPSADPTRPAATVRVIVSMQNSDGNLEGNRRGTQMQGNSVIGLRPVRVFIRAGTYAAIGSTLIPGDMVELIDTDNGRAGERYTVTRVATGDTGDVTLEVATSDPEP